MGGDEIAQVCQIEIAGVQMVVKGGVEVAKWMLKAIRALIVCDPKTIPGALRERHVQRKEEKAQKKEEDEEEKLEAGLATAGAHSQEEIMKISAQQGGTMQIIDIPESRTAEILDILEANGVRYAGIVDFIPDDGKIPIMFAPQDAAIVTRVVNSFYKEKLAADEDICREYNTRIAETKEKLLHEADPEEKERLENVLANLQQAREEKVAMIDYEKKHIEEGGVYSFEEYLMQSKNTEFEKDPDKAVTEYEYGVDIGKSYAAKECMQPIRDPELIPETKLRFVLPETGVTITRSFEKDPETDLAYSTYNFKTESGEMYEFSDHNYSPKTWSEKILPDLLDKAGILEDTPCRVFNSEARLEAYQKYHNQVTPHSEENVKKALSEGKEVFTSADAKKEIEHAVSESMKGRASASIVNDRVKISVDPEMLMRQHGKLSLQMENGDAYLFSGMENERIEGRKFVFELKKDTPVLQINEKMDGKDPVGRITAVDLQSRLSEKKTNVEAIMKSHQGRK